jgi:serine O-acetyltransferase
LKKIVNQDLRAKFTGEEEIGLKHFLYLIAFERTWRNLFYFRSRNYVGGSILRLFLKQNADTFIKPSLELGNYARFVHPHCVHINCDSIGHHLIIYHCITIGGINGKTPIIGNNVTIGCHSAILGDVKIGNNVNIGAGTIVTKDIPDNCTVIGNHAVIVRQNGDKVHIEL